MPREDTEAPGPNRQVEEQMLKILCPEMQKALKSNRGQKHLHSVVDEIIL